MNPRALAASVRLERLREIPEAVESALRSALRIALTRGEARTALTRATVFALDAFDEAAQGAGLPSAERMRRRTEICAMLAGCLGSRLAQRLRALPRRAMRLSDGAPVDLLVESRGELFGIRFALQAEPLVTARLASDAFRRYPAMRGFLLYDLTRRRTRHIRSAVADAA